MTELFKQYGFEYTGSCQCDGRHTEKFRKGGYEIRVRIRNEVYKVKLDGRSQTQWNPLSMLEGSLKIITDVAIPA